MSIILLPRHCYVMADESVFFMASSRCFPSANQHSYCCNWSLDRQPHNVIRCHCDKTVRTCWFSTLPRQLQHFVGSWKLIYFGKLT